MALPVPGLHGAHLRSDLVDRFGQTRIANAVRSGELQALWRGVLVEPARLLDLLCQLRPQDALAVIDQALAAAGEAHQVFRKQVAVRLEQRQDIRGTVRAAGLLDLASERVDSPAESWIRLLVVEHGLPIPEVNWPINDATGREIYRLDLAWPRFRIALEYDGVAAHAGQEDHDAARRADLERRGWIVVVVTKDDLGAFTRVVTALRAAFTARGYTW
jgi:Protein of unknown function (DUF559)